MIRPQVEEVGWPPGRRAELALLRVLAHADRRWRPRTHYSYLLFQIDRRPMCSMLHLLSCRRLKSSLGDSGRTDLASSHLSFQCPLCRIRSAMRRSVDTSYMRPRHHDFRQLVLLLLRRRIARYLRPRIRLSQAKGLGIAFPGPPVVVRGLSLIGTRSSRSSRGCCENRYRILIQIFVTEPCAR